MKACCDKSPSRTHCSHYIDAHLVDRVIFSLHEDLLDNDVLTELIFSVYRRSRFACIAQVMVRVIRRPVSESDHYSNEKRLLFGG